MDETSRHLRNKYFIQLVLLVLTFVTLHFVTYEFKDDVNRSITDLVTYIGGESLPDSNIVLIGINQQDIDAVGPWPIKRSYYALLIKELSDLNVKKIGLEVFLSSRFSTQNIYDNLLKKEIEEARKVVLSSLAGEMIEIEGHYRTDSLSYPSPKLIDENFVTGHINYLEEDALMIPLFLRTSEGIEKAFSLQLADSTSGLGEVLHLNFHSSWKKFTTYSLFDFFDLINNQSKLKESFKGKIVLIGITDPEIASEFTTPFDEKLPGIALHAFAVDNIINGRDLKGSVYFFTLLSCFFVFLILVFFNRMFKNNLLFYLLVFLFITVSAFLLQNYFYWKIAYGYFIIPFILLFITEVIFNLVTKKSELKGALDEGRVLKLMLEKKEKELELLEDELDISEDVSDRSVIEKIRKLKSDINKLRGSEDDKIPAEDITEDFSSVEGLVYRSKKMEQVVNLINKSAGSDATVLITGESGTGKELVASAIHNLSERKEKKFIPVNCAALSETLLESELFGHVKGAFTGASSNKQGLFEAADKGTIFLDEIGETSENFQVKLLRVLQTGEVTKVGSTKTEFVDVRVIAATNKNIKELVSQKAFREDLYYRINVINIFIPPLRERREDIEVLTDHFIKKEGKDVKISVAVAKALREYEWKGNVRELESVIKRAVIFLSSEKRDIIKMSDLPDEIIKEVKFDFDDLVLQSLRERKFSHSSISETAKELGDVNRTTVAENLRGISFKAIVENDFNIEKASNFICDECDDEVEERLINKLNTYLSNIEKDVQKTGSKDFAKVKDKLKAKYKNLPQKFHHYLDEIIKYYL